MHGPTLAKFHSIKFQFVFLQMRPRNEFNWFLGGTKFLSKSHITFHSMGRGGGQVVSVLDFYSVDPSSNPADVYSFFCKICV